MASSRCSVLARFVAALLGLALIVPVLFVQVPLSEPGVDPGALSVLLVLGAPCGLLLYFARTGRWSWGSALFLPALDLVQSAAVVNSLALFPHTRAAHVTAAVAASWLLVVVVHLVRSPRPGWRRAA